MRRGTSTLLAGVAAAALLVVATGTAQAESTLKAVAAFPKTNAQTISFLKFIDYVNGKEKGILHIDYIGGPEVTPPNKQPIALRNGLFDLLFGPPAYYLGLFPEGDAMDGTKSPVESRAVGGFKMIDAAARKKLGATFLGRFNFGIYLNVFLRDKPSFKPNGDLDLHGQKIRSSGSYLDFLKALGATPVTMPTSEIYTALERGVVDGAAASLTDAYTDSFYKFLKYRIEPPFSKGVVILIGNAKSIDGLPAKAQKRLRADAIAWERISMNSMAATTQKYADLLAKVGQHTVTLKGAAAKRYIATYEDGVWARVKKNDVDLNIEKAEAAFR